MSPDALRLTVFAFHPLIVEIKSIVSVAWEGRSRSPIGPASANSRKAFACMHRPLPCQGKSTAWACASAGLLVRFSGSSTPSVTFWSSLVRSPSERSRSLTFDVGCAGKTDKSRGPCAYQAQRSLSPPPFKCTSLADPIGPFSILMKMGSLPGPRPLQSAQLSRVERTGDRTPPAICSTTLNSRALSCRDDCPNVVTVADSS